MGQSKTTVSSNTTTTPTATPEETELNKLEIERQKRLMEPTIALQQKGIDLTSQMLAGGQLPGYLGQVAQGVNVSQINPNDYMTSESDINQMITKSLQSLYPQFQNQGILDSGVAADIAARSALGIRADINQQNKETALGINQFNVQNKYSADAFNQGNLLNLLNLGLGGQAQVQQPILASADTLSQRLAGLRPTTSVSGGTTIAPRQQSYLWGLYSQQ